MQHAHTPSTRSSFTLLQQLQWLLLYVLLLAILCTQMPAETLRLRQHEGFLLIGVLGIWRYGWAAVNMLRALVYRYIVFPRIRRAVTPDAAPLYILVLSYQIEPTIFRRCYAALISEAMVAKRPITIVAAVGTQQEQQQLDSLFAHLGGRTNPVLTLIMLLQRGAGKRVAMAEGLRAITRLLPPADAEVILMDGDTVVQPGIFRKTSGFFKSLPTLGAFTVDNTAVTSGTKVVQEWYTLRLTQRHILMCAQSLSRRVLCLTGRYSVFRGSIALSPHFINRLEHDVIEHWHHGSIPLLTGDDKSTWFTLLENQWDMLYVPDVRVQCLEQQQQKNFLLHSLPLMHRWFGNMLRNNSRAIALGWQRMPLFTWWSLIDQRLSMWTALSAPLAVLLLALFASYGYAWLYVTWVLFSRFLYGVLLGVVRQRFSPLYPLLLFYNQVVGSLVKIHTYYRLPRQRWAQRQPGILATVMNNRQEWFAAFCEVSALSGYAFALALILNLLSLPSL